MPLNSTSRHYFKLRRDARVIANRVPRLPSTGFHKFILPVALSRSDSDRRYFHPAGVMRPLKSVFGSPVRAVPYVKPVGFTPFRYGRSGRVIARPMPMRSSFVGGYKLPALAAVCVRRNIRREVLFATGRGGGGKRPPKFNYTSSYRC